MRKAKSINKENSNNWIQERNHEARQVVEVKKMTKQFVKEHNINYEVTNAPENMDLAKAVGGIKSIPTMFLIDKENTIFQKLLLIHHHFSLVLLI